MEERDKKAIELPNDMTKQILIPSTGIVFLPLLLIKDFVPENFNGTLAVRVF